MERVQCENPKCHKRIPKHTAYVFQDGEFWNHYCCPSEICTTRAILAVDLKFTEGRVFTEAFENCR